MPEDPLPEIYEDKSYEELSEDVEYDLENFKDPYVVGAMIHRLVKERQLSNLMLKEIKERIDELEEKVEVKKERKKRKLTKTDKEVLEYVRKEKEVCASDVKEKFDYKGKNAASARLNKLHKKGFLDKERAGKKVYFHISTE